MLFDVREPLQSSGGLGFTVNSGNDRSTVEDRETARHNMGSRLSGDRGEPSHLCGCKSIASLAGIYELIQS